MNRSGLAIGIVAEVDVYLMGEKQALYRGR